MNMLTKTLLLAGGLFLVAVLATNAKADPLVDQVRTPVVRLDAFCSGTIISSKRDDKTGKVATYVLTAKHCVKDNEKDTIPIAKDKYNGLDKAGKTIYDATVYGTSYKSDLALLKLRDDQTFFDKVAKVADKDINLQFGQAVVVDGYPLGLSMTETEGKLGYKEEQPAFSDISQSKMFYRASPDIVGGSSGSGLFTFDNGEYKLIGVVTGGYQRATYINYFTPIDEIRDYLATALADDFAPKKEEEKTKVETPKTFKSYQ